MSSPSRTSIYRVSVSFGDCDPAGIVFFPNFSRWMDAASHHFFRSCGLPPWRDLQEIPHCVGNPLLEIQTRFLKPVTYGDEIEVHTSIDSWQRKTFVQRHRVMRGGELMCEGTETRALCVRLPDSPVKSVPIPDWLRERCS